MPHINDSYKHKGLRKRLVRTLKEKGIRNQNVLNAINVVPRHVFFESAFAEQAYEDKAFPIGSGQTISQPYTVAYQTELLDPKPGEKVLEIGTGSGYQASVLAEMGVSVWSVERIEALSRKADHILKQLGYDVRVFCDDGSKGLPEYAPFDGILITAAAPEIPEVLLKQLAINGRLILPVGDELSQQMIRITRSREDTFQTRKFDKFRFVPLIGEHGWRTK